MILALTFRTILVIINIAAVAVIVGVISYKVLSVRRTPKEKSPQNLTPFYDDTELEGNHLERVLRWALLFSTIVAVVLPLYWVLEPNRQTAEAEGFEERAIERGAVLYANDQMEAYDGAKSLLCANCHGIDASGGSAPYTITPDAQGNPNARPVQVNWRAPALNTIMYRFNECTDEDVAELAPLCPRAEQQVTQIITYGRQGTPMPAWGIEGGGPKNDQAISDIVAYLKSIQLTPAKAKEQVQEQVKTLKDEADDGVENAEDTLDGGRGEPGRRGDGQGAPGVHRCRSRAPGSRSSARGRSSSRSRTRARASCSSTCNAPAATRRAGRTTTRQRRSSRSPHRRQRRARPVAAGRLGARAVPGSARPTTRRRPASRSSTSGSPTASRSTRATACAASRPAAWRTSATS